MPTGIKVDLCPGDIVLHGDQPPKGQPSKFRPMCVVAKRLDGSRCHLVRRYIGLGAGHIVLDGDAVPLSKGA